MSTELELLAAEAATCTRCRLHESRTQVVFGQGSPTAEVMFVGEAPGFHEDVYICNVVKSRPPNNRDPQADEIAACRPWLDGQIRLVDPKVVVTLGNFAAKTLLGTATGITRLRGRTYPFQGRLLLPTFHPAAALRAERTSGGSPTMQGMEEDFQHLAKLLADLQPAPEAEDLAPEAPDGPDDGSQLGLF